MTDPDLPTSTPPRNPEERQRLKRLYLTLLFSGLAVGGVLAAGLVVLLQRLGLTQSPGG